MLRPGTRRKLQILGEDYKEVLTELLETLPPFLGGDCSCPKCLKIIGKANNMVGPSIEYEVENVRSSHSGYPNDEFEFIKCDRVLKSIVIGLLVLLLCIVYNFRFRSPEVIQLYRRDGW